MDWKRKLMALAGALVLTTGLNATALAQATTSDTVSVTLGGGVISFSIDVTANLSPLSYSHLAGYTDGSGGVFTVFVKDDRNTNTGYVIGLAASNFIRSNGGGSIVLGSTGTLSVPSVGSVTRTGDVGDPINLPTPNTATSLSSNAVPILTAGAGFGNGHYTASGYALALTGVSAVIPTGAYTSTLTVSSTAGPQQS